MDTASKVERGFTIVRRIDALRELVFRAWTDPDHLHWFAGATPTPNHPTTVDLRVGGTWRLLLVENENKSYPTGGIYHEVVPPEKLVFTWGAVDGWPNIDPSKPDESPLVTVIFEEVDGSTEMTFRLELADHLTEAQVRDWFAIGIRPGWTDTLDRLVPYLKTINAGRPSMAEDDHRPSRDNTIGRSLRN